MKTGNFNLALRKNKRNGSIINRLGKLGDSKDPIFNRGGGLPPIEVRWIRLNPGDVKNIPHKHEVVQTLIILIRGRHDVIVNKKKKVNLSREGDYIFIEPDDLHTWKTRKDTLILVIRWKIK